MYTQPIYSAKGNKIVNTKYIHFAHANGFPAGSYRKFLSQLPSDFTIIAKDKFAHDDQFPLNDNWSNQVDELIDYVENNTPNGTRAIAMGHSFGAVLSYMAVCKRPDLFSGLIMLDPPLITGLARYVFRFAKRNRLINKLTPAALTDVRIRRWDKDHDLVHYFAKKQLFKNFDPECIQDYVDSVMLEKDDARHLSFDVHTEANIFRTIPHNLPDFAGQLTLPSILVTGINTDVCVPVLRKPFLKRNPIVEHIEFAHGAHMFPLEFPLELAKLISQSLEHKFTTKGATNE